jgi:hypothetical protein
VQAFQAEASRGVRRIDFVESGDAAIHVPEWEAFECVVSSRGRSAAAAGSDGKAASDSKAAADRDGEEQPYPVVSCACPTSGVMIMGPAVLADWNGPGQALTWKQFRDGEAPVLWFSGDAGGRMPCVPQGDPHDVSHAVDAGWVPAVATTTELLLSSAAAPEGRFAVELTSHDLRVADYEYWELTWRASSDRVAEVQNAGGFAVTTEGYRVPRCTTLSQVLFNADDETNYPTHASTAT